MLKLLIKKIVYYNDNIIYISQIYKYIFFIRIIYIMINA